MRVCLIATEIFAHGVFGGFGALTRDIARGLVAKGVETYVLVPRQKDQKPIEVMDGINVVSYKSDLYLKIKPALKYSSIFDLVDADVYHSEEPSLGTRLALIGASNKKHMVTFQDPRDLNDWKKQWEKKDLTYWEELKFRLAYYHFGIGKAVKEVDACYCQAKYIIEKSKRLFNLKEVPGFLPNPVHVPRTPAVKSTEPSVCFLGRWDPIKRPEYFFELARKFKDIKFYITGGCQPHYLDREYELKERYKDLPNLVFLGWVFGEEKAKILEKCWVLINTSTKECLPVSYLEACAYKCAILSHGNADNFASEFGYWVKSGTLEEYEEGLSFLLKDNAWKAAGEKGYRYVLETHEYDAVINRHIEVYSALLNK